MERIVSRFKGKLIKAIKDGNGRFDDMNWGYELVKTDLL